MNSFLEITWTEVIVAYFKVLSRYLPGRIKEKEENQ